MILRIKGRALALNGLTTKCIEYNFQLIWAEWHNILVILSTCADKIYMISTLSVSAMKAKFSNNSFY
jgi:hypothetical protein